MKKIYWRPRAVSRTGLILIALLSIGGIMLVENFRVVDQQPWYREKLDAALLARKATDVIRELRLLKGYPIDPDNDPAETGLIGIAMSPVTSISGVLEAKQTSTNPNFAAVVVDMLKRVDAGPGDTVAVGCSGSFPGLNVAVYAALETLKLKPIIVSSAAASQWGANIPDLMWIDMESALYQRDLISFRSKYASIGGYEDSGLGLTEEGRAIIEEVIRRNGVELIDPAETFTETVDRRIKLFKNEAGGALIKCYVNVGGGTISVGRSLGKKLFHPGLNLKPPARYKRVDGLLSRFASEGIPVIHLTQVNDLAERYGLALASTTAPNIGEANVFQAVAYREWLAIGVLLLIIGSLYGLIRSDVGARLLRINVGRAEGGYPEPMV